MQVGASSNTRIEWCDIFKGIVIVLMVVGHCTGRFNSYIYQFHMAAFFFISGYVRKSSSQSFFEEAFTSFCKTLWPFYMLNVFGVILYFFLDRLHMLSYLSVIQFPYPLQLVLLNLLNINTIPCDLFGATWFLPVLFTAGLIFRLLVKGCKKDWLILVVSIPVFLFSQGKKWAFFLDLAGMAQTYLIYGYLAHKGSLRLSKKLPFWAWGSGFVLISIIWSLSIRNGFYYGMDWPSRQFSGPMDLVFPIIGICWAVFTSKTLESIWFLKKLFVSIGKNSMGIMCFHFVGFKVAYLFLIAAGKMEWSDFSSLVPPLNLGLTGCVFIVAVSVFSSLMLWEGIKKVKFLRLAMGQFNGKKLYSSLLHISIWNDLILTLEWTASLIKETMAQYFAFLKAHMKRH